MRSMQQNKDVFLWLVRMGIKAESAYHQPIITEAATVNWDVIQDLATQHGLSAVVLDGIEQLPEQQRPPKLFLLEWIGETLQGYEYRYELYQRAITELAAFYNSHGFKMMVLKGYACSLDWPKPEHRPCGDIDIWLFGQQKDADSALAFEKKLNIDDSLHHTVFAWNDFTVENHYDFINIHRHKTHQGLENVFKQLSEDDTHCVDVYGEKVYLPSPNLHALFLLRHALNHFVSSGITLRQVLDWALFVENHTNEIDWKWFNEMIEKYNMKEFFSCLNAICVEDLGFNAKIFHGVQFSPALKDKVLNDIINPEFDPELPKRLLPKIVYMYKRWRGNAWKYEFCYKENRWSSFWSGLSGYLFKPLSK